MTSLSSLWYNISCKPFPILFLFSEVIYMSWDIVLGIIELIGAAIIVCGPLAKLTQMLTRLDVTLTELRESVKEIKEHSSEVHRRLWAEIDLIKRQLFKDDNL